MSDCPVCMGIEGYNIHMCGKGSGGTTLNHSGTSAAELLQRIAELEAEVEKLKLENRALKTARGPLGSGRYG
jgi:uncharacterized small protein (DUF1192 family)